MSDPSTNSARRRTRPSARDLVRRGALFSALALGFANTLAFGLCATQAVPTVWVLAFLVLCVANALSAVMAGVELAETYDINDEGPGGCGG